MLACMVFFCSITSLFFEFSITLFTYTIAYSFCPPGHALLRLAESCYRTCSHVVVVTLAHALLLLLLSRPLAGLACRYGMHIPVAASTSFSTHTEGSMPVRNCVHF
jgi:hypothetical protein